MTASPLTRSRPSASITLSRKGRGLLVLLLALLLPLAACGKKAEPGPPADEPNVYPRSYPHE